MKKFLLGIFLGALFILNYGVVLASVEPVYRFWSSKNKSHFYTMSESEKDYVIANYDEYVWKYEGISNYALSSSSISNNDISPSASIEYSKLDLGSSITSANITNGTIINDDVNSAASIAYSKLNLTGNIQSSDLASNGCSIGQVLKYGGVSWACGDDNNTGSTIGNTVESSEITNGTIVDVDINSSAAIAYSKLNLGSSIDSTNITNDTIINADINSSAAIDSDKINFTNKTINIFDGNISGDDSSELSAGTSCGSGGDCTSVTKDKIEVNNHNVTDYSVEMIASCTDGAEYSCSNQMDDQPVVRFYDEGSATNILVGMSSGGVLAIENGDGTAYNGELRLGSVRAYGNVQSDSATIGGGSGEYLQFGNTSAGAPLLVDCDEDTERGRMSIDITNNRLYICNGATRGWDYTTLTD